jgi:hypothetical protein
MTATHARERCLLIVSLSDHTLIALEWGGLTPLFQRKHRVGMFNFTDSIVINASAP